MEQKENSKVDAVIARVNNFKKLCKKARNSLRFLAFSIFFCVAGTISSFVSVLKSTRGTLEYVTKTVDLNFFILLTVIVLMSYYFLRDSTENDLQKLWADIEKDIDEVIRLYVLDEILEEYF